MQECRPSAFLHWFIGNDRRLTLIGGWNYANVWMMMGGRCRVIAFAGLQLKVVE
jgi:hypothetical protein